MLPQVALDRAEVKSPAEDGSVAERVKAAEATTRKREER
jgi:hypothetical protein